MTPFKKNNELSNGSYSLYGYIIAFFDTSPFLRFKLKFVINRYIKTE